LDRRAHSTSPETIAVIFEVWPADGRKEHYLSLAQRLRDDLQQMDWAKRGAKLGRRAHAVSNK
jgi:hypothetical protein